MASSGGHESLGAPFRTGHVQNGASGLAMLDTDGAGDVAPVAGLLSYAMPARNAATSIVVPVNESAPVAHGLFLERSKSVAGQ